MSENQKITSSASEQVIWLFGRPCAGKTTLATAIHNHLTQRGVSSIILDGDELRKGLNKDLGFSLHDRQENIRRTAELARLIASKGIFVICSLVTPTQKIRNLVRQTIQDKILTMVFVEASLSVCISRDSKGHYSQARKGHLTDFTGIGSPFEVPKNYDCLVNTTELTPEEAAEKVLAAIIEY